MRPQGTPTRRFEALFDAHAQAILGYALRRVTNPADAADVVSETFLVAWRRIDVVPLDEPRLWLYAVARKVLANTRRGTVRRDRLGERLRQELGSAAPPDEPDPRTDAIREAMATLPADDQELLRLAFWEGLAPTEIATVLGIPDPTARTRLHRARNRLRVALEANAPPMSRRSPVATGPTPFEEMS